jgi:hypothetical protein
MREGEGDDEGEGILGRPLSDGVKQFLSLLNQVNQMLLLRVSADRNGSEIT